MRALLPLVTLLLASCAAPRQVDAHRYERRTFYSPDGRPSVEVFARREELREIEFDELLEDLLGDGIEDVERERVGLRVGWGDRVFRGWVQIVAEEIDDYDDSELPLGTALTIDDLYGAGIGLAGESPLGWIGPEIPFLIAVEAEATWLIGEAELTDNTPMPILASPVEDDRVEMIDTWVQLGFGPDLRGVRPFFGVYLSHLEGEIDDDVLLMDSDQELEFFGTNTGLFAQLSWLPEGLPVQVSLRAVTGRVESLQATVGVTF